MSPLLDYPQHPLQTVLIGSSLGDESDQVVRSGLAVARAAGARVLLVHVVEIEPHLVNVQAGLAADLTAEQVAGREESLHRQIERLGVGGLELAGARVLTGAPHRVLVETARSAGADLIVVGAAGAGPFAELLGSTADRVVRKASCPVLLVRGQLRVPPRRILAPVDLSSISGDAFRCGLDLLAQLSRPRSEPSSPRASWMLWPCSGSRPASFLRRERSASMPSSYGVSCWRTGAGRGFTSTPPCCPGRRGSRSCASSTSIPPTS
jgi:nucleotide-binding universal stress UspA family protein